LNLTEDERNELNSSGRETVFYNRVRWSRDYLSKACLLENHKRGFFRITERGKKVLNQRPKEIDSKFLSQFPEFSEFKKLKKESFKFEEEIDEALNKTPQELIDYGYQQIRKDLEIELLKLVKNCSALFFEKLVVDLLVRMGYGGSISDAGKAIGKSKDGGIDGIIKEDKLGLDIVYIQAKRWDQTVVGSPEIQKFAGALQGKKARKGVFITTSKFSRDAREYVKLIDSKIVLIDGQELAKFMIDNNVGVFTVDTYEIKKIYSDYFTDE
jgi:restriction system protein